MVRLLYHAQSLNIWEPNYSRAPVYDTAVWFVRPCDAVHVIQHKRSLPCRMRIHPRFIQRREASDCSWEMSMTRATSLSWTQRTSGMFSIWFHTKSRLPYEVVRRQVQMQKAETGGQGKLWHIETHEKCSRVYRGGESRQGCHTSPLLCWC